MKRSTESYWLPKYRWIRGIPSAVHSGRRYETRVNGDAIDPVDPGSIPWTKHVVQHVARISKLV